MQILQQVIIRQSVLLHYQQTQLDANNAAVGYQSLQGNTEGSGLTAMGSEALEANTTGDFR